MHNEPFSPAIPDMREQAWQPIEAPGKGKATVFTLHIAGIREEGFVVGSAGHLHAYHNRCPHNGSTLDWVPGRFFSEDGEALLCQTHGALFAPDSGACLSGPCPTGLTRLPVREEAGRFFVPTILDRIPPPG